MSKDPKKSHTETSATSENVIKPILAGHEASKKIFAAHEAAKNIFVGGQAAAKAFATVDNIFSKASVVFSTLNASKNEDNGLRSTVSGALYSDKSIFYKRPEVLKALAEIKEAVPVLIHSDTDKS